MQKEKMTNRGLVLPSVLLLGLLLVLSSCGPQGPRSSGRLQDGESWIGVSVQDLDSDLRRYLAIDERYGVLVNEVAEDSPADKGGLRKEDVIVRFDGKRVRNSNDLRRAVQKTEPGEKVRVEFVRNGKRRKARLRIEARPERYAKRSQPRKPDRPFSWRRDGPARPWLGIQMQELNAELAEYFDVSEDGGALILKVEEDSPAEEAGLRAGDVIVAVDDADIGAPDDVREQLKDSKPGDEIEIKVVRKGNKKTLRAELGRSPFFEPFYFDKERWRDFKEELEEWQKHYRDDVEDFRKNLRQEIEENLRRSLEDVENSKLTNGLFQRLPNGVE